jgi:hypothetical protein
MASIAARTAPDDGHHGASHAHLGPGEDDGRVAGRFWIWRRGFRVVAEDGIPQCCQLNRWKILNREISAICFCEHLG